MKLARIFVPFLLALACFGQGTPERKPTAPCPIKPDENNAGSASKPGKVVGTLVDNAGAVIIGATVMLGETGAINKIDHDAKRDVSDQDGKFSFEQIRPGLYQLDVSKPLFKTVHIRQIEVFDGKTTVLNVALATKEGVDLCMDCEGSVVLVDPTSTAVQT